MIKQALILAASGVALLTLAACKPPVDTAKEADAIKAVETQWVADTKTKDPAKFAKSASIV